MASQLKVDTITGVTTAGSIAVTGEGNSTTTNLQQGLAKVWISVTSTVSIHDSLNTSSGTDHGTGDYSYNLTNAFTTINGYSQTTAVFTTAAGATCTRNSGRDAANIIAVEVSNAAGTLADDSLNTTAHGDLA